MIHALECVGIEVVVLAVAAALVYGLCRGLNLIGKAIEGTTTAKVIGTTSAGLILAAFCGGVLFLIGNVLVAVYHGICLFMGHGA